MHCKVPAQACACLLLHALAFQARGADLRKPPGGVLSDTQIAAQVKDFDAAGSFPSPKEARRSDRFAQFGIAAAHRALLDSGLELDKADRAARLPWSTCLWLPAAASRHQTLRRESQRGQPVDNILRYQADSQLPASERLYRSARASSRTKSGGVGKASGL